MKSETGETPEAFYCCVKIAGTPSGRKKRFSSTVFHKGAVCPVPEFRQRRRIFPSVLDAQAALVAKGWNPDKFQIVEEETNPKSEIQ